MLSTVEASLPLRFQCQHNGIIVSTFKLMRHADLPERWKTKVSEYLIATGETKYKTLGCYHFPPDSLVRIKFEDGSIAEFKHAFVIKAPEWQEVAVFTEHCGYHLFRLYDELDLVVY